MNRSRYVTRPIDRIDHAIIEALFANSRMTVRELASQIGLSSPSVTERIHKLEDAGAIAGYTISIDPRAFGLGIIAHLRVKALPGEVRRLAQQLIDTPEIIEADRVTGEDSFVAKVAVSDIDHLEKVVDSFLPLASTDIAIVQSSPVGRRLPRL